MKHIKEYILSNYNELINNIKDKVLEVQLKFKDDNYFENEYIEDYLSIHLYFENRKGNEEEAKIYITNTEIEIKTDNNKLKNILKNLIKKYINNVKKEENKVVNKINFKL